MKNIRTIRKFKQTPISHKDLEEIMNEVRNASCANNNQVLSYVVLEKEAEKMHDLVHFAGRLQWSPERENYPVNYVIICRPDGLKGFSDIDIGIVCHIITEAAYDKGIGSIIFGSHNPRIVREVFSLDKEPRIIIGLGYPDHTSEIVDYKDDVSYYMDEDENFYVPKIDMNDITEYR